MIENVVIVSNSGSIKGGASKVAIETALILSEQDLNIYFFCGSGPICDELKESAVKTRCLETLPYYQRKNNVRAAIEGLYDKKAESAFSSFIKELPAQTTVVHFHSWLHSLSPALFRTTKKLGLKVFVTIHDYSLVCPNAGLFNFKRNTICDKQPMTIKCFFENCDKRSWMQKVYRYIRMKIMLRFVRQNEIVKIFISKFNKRVFELAQTKRIGREPCEYLPNPILEKEQIPSNEQGRDNKYLFVGRLSPEKGVRLFCQAVTDLEEPAVVIGDGELRKSLENQFPNIAFLGWQTEETVYSRMSSSKALIFPSLWYEGAPLTILEAQYYANLPCIVPDKCAASEFVDDKKTGLIFDSGSVESIKCCLSQMSDIEVRREMRRNIKKKSFEEYSKGKYCLDLLAIYKRVRT